MKNSRMHKDLKDISIIEEREEVNMNMNNNNNNNNNLNKVNGNVNMSQYSQMTYLKNTRVKEKY